MSGQLPLREFTIDTPEGNTLGVCLWGDPDGAPMFWLHGTPGSRMLRHDADDYRARRLHVCTYDRPGYGLSTRKPGRTVADAADDVGVLADAFGWEEFGVAGVSNGGPPALAVAARMPDRVSRCAAVVTVGPATAPDLDFLAGMDERARNRRSAALRGDSDALRQEWDDVIAWATEATGDEDGEIDPILAETLEAAGPHGVDGFVDDHLSVVRNWGFTVEAIRVPVRIMLAREDTSVPAAHGEWLASHLREGELLWVDGDHFGPRNDSEMRLIEWVALG